MTLKVIRDSINKELHSMGFEYYPEVPLSDIFAIVEKKAGMVVQEDGTPWSGLLCGDDGRAKFEVAGYKFLLHLTWHRMPSGNYEIVAYVS